MAPTKTNPSEKNLKVERDSLVEIKDKNGKVIPEWQVKIQQKLWEARKEGKDEKFKALAEIYNGKLNAMMDMYFTSYSEDEEEDNVSFNIINKEWMTLTSYVNSTQKVIELKADAFSKNVQNVKLSEEWKNRKNPSTETTSGEEGIDTLEANEAANDAANESIEGAG